MNGAKIKLGDNKWRIQEFELPYEKQYTSQNGEDGIFEYLNPFIKNKFFVELGWGNGFVNNCRYILEHCDYDGVGIDMRENKNTKLKKHIQKKIEVNDVDIIKELNEQPGIFSIDIDSYDWTLLKNLLDSNYRPEVIVHEYNAIWGPDKKIVRKPDCNRFDKVINYGASLSAYKLLLEKNYTFITVDTMGINAFWIRKDIKFIMPEKTLDFKYNQRTDTSKKLKDYKIDNHWSEL